MCIGCDGIIVMFFNLHYLAIVLRRCIAYGKNISISIGEKSAGLSLGAAGFEMNTASFQPSNPASRKAPRR